MKDNHARINTIKYVYPIKCFCTAGKLAMFFNVEGKLYTLCKKIKGQTHLHKKDARTKGAK